MRRWFEYIMLHARARPEQPAMIMEDRVVTYGMLAGGIDRCARRIVALHLAGDAPVAILVRNPIRHLTLALALFRIGARSLSLEHGQTGITGLSFAAILGDEEARRVLGPEQRIIAVDDSWFTVDSAPTETLPPSFSRPAQSCRVSLTSGVTGSPKQIDQRVADIGSRIETFADLNWTVMLCLPGLSSNYGFTSACAPLATGRTLGFAESPFQAARMIQLFSIDLLVAAPEQLLALTRVARKTAARLESLRRVEIGGSVATRALLESAMIHVCNQIGSRYGASETGVIARTTGREVLARPGLAGWLEPGVEVGIFDSEGRRCAAGRPGLIRIRHEAEEIAPAAACADWIELGDFGWMAADGQLHVLGRAWDASAGVEMSPVYEVEDLLRLEWDMTDGAAVLLVEGGVAQIWVGVVDGPEADADTLAALARTRGIGHPITLFTLSAIPRGANGKVNRTQLKALMSNVTCRPAAS